MDNTSNPLFIDQEDGSALPSPELLDRIRANPDKYPTAAQDLADLSGKTIEEVEAIIANGTPQSAWETEGVWGVAKQAVRNDPVIGGLLDIYQGEAEAAAVFSDKLGFEDAAETIRGAADSLDPKFESEQGVVENITEGVGQSVPAIGAGIAAGALTGGTGAIPLIAGSIAGATVDTATFENEDNAFNMLQEIVPDLTPDALVVTEEDDDTTGTVKHFIGNLVMDGAISTVAHAVKPLLTAVSRGASPEELKPLLREAQEAVEGPTMTTAQIKDVTAQVAERRMAQKVALIEKRPGAVVDPVDPVERKAFHEDVFGGFHRLTERAEEVNTASAVRFSVEKKPLLVKYVDDVLETVAAGDYAQAAELLRKGIRIGKNRIEDNHVAVLEQSLLRAVQNKVEANYDQIVKAIRQDPALRTKGVWRRLSSDYLDAKAKIGELDRLQGSSAAYQFLVRKGVKFKGGVEEVLEAEKYLKETYKDDLKGFDLFANREDYIAANSLKLEDMGINSVDVIDTLERQFEEFDKVRAGLLDNLKTNRASRLTPEEKNSLTASFVRMVKDIQATALLGQPSTTALEVFSNTFNNMLLPILEHGVIRNPRKIAQTYAGYLNAWKTAAAVTKKAWKAGEGVVDAFDATEGAHFFSYPEFKTNPIRHLMLRLFKAAADISIASGEFWKATRGFGLAYVDGIEMAMKNGMGRVEAKRFAREFAQSQFDETGRLTNVMYRNDVSRTSWQAAFDTRYTTGKLAQAVDNYRNRNDLIGLTARSALPFFRTLVNIGSDSFQMIVPPGLPTLLKKLGKDRELPKVIKALDDFTGANGVAAQNRAIGRHRLGMTLVASMATLPEIVDGIEITGPSGFQQWDAKKRAAEGIPANSIVIGDTAYDLTRFLPFSAPLMMAGMMRDMVREDRNRIEGANYSTPDMADYMVNYFPALGLTALTLFQDSGAAQGVFDLMTAVNEAQTTGDTGALKRYLQGYAKQYIPGPVKVIAKNTDPHTYEGYDFYSQFLASAGLPTEFKRLDFVGQEIIAPFGRGINFTNPKALKLDDPLYAKFAELNRYEDLGMALPRPDDVFKKAEWKSIGVDVGNTWDSGNLPNLSTMKLPDGRNAWDAYRTWVYQGKITEGEVKKSTAMYGDRIYVGDVRLRPGENLEQTLRRLVASEDFHNMTSDAQAKVFETTLGIFKEHAKDYLKANLMVDPGIFEGSRYGAPIKEPTSIEDTVKAGKKLATSVQVTKGSRLEDAFAIKD